MRLSQLLAERFTLVVSLPDNDLDLARAALEAGAHGLKVHMNVHHRASGTSFGSWEQERERLLAIRRLAGERPVGIVAGGHPGVPLAEVASAVQAGFATISMFAQHLPARWFALAGAEFMVAPDAGCPVEEVAALGRLPVAIVEAAVVPPEGYGQPLTALDLMRYAAIAAAVPQPVVVPSQRRITPEDVTALAAVGVRGVMIGAVVTGQKAGEVYAATAAFRRAVERV